MGRDGSGDRKAWPDRPCSVSITPESGRPLGSNHWLGCPPWRGGDKTRPWPVGTCHPTDRLGRAAIRRSWSFVRSRRDAEQARTIVVRALLSLDVPFVEVKATVGACTAAVKQLCLTTRCRRPPEPLRHDHPLN